MLFTAGAAGETGAEAALVCEDVLALGVVAAAAGHWVLLAGAKGGFVVV